MTHEKPAHFRALTAGEIALAQRVFGHAIRYDKVGITARPFMPFQPRGTAMAPDGNLYMHGCYHDDYAATSALTQSHFIHEMAHVWQKQNGVLDPIASALRLSLAYRFNYNAAYFYTLDAGRDLCDYNMEQQATIIQDYFLRHLCGHSHDTGHCRNSGAAQAENLYEAVLKKFLADPAYARPQGQRHGPHKGQHGGPPPPAA